MVLAADELIHRVEASSAQEGLALARSMGASHQAMGTGALIALGPGRFVNRAVGLSLQPFDSGHLAEVETFFRTNKVTPAIEVATGASSDLISMLDAHGFEPLWSRAVHAFPLTGSQIDSASPDARIELVSDPAVWVDLIADGNEITDPNVRRASDELANAAFSVPRGETYILAIDGTPAGCGSIQIMGHVAWLGGAATLPKFRGQGIQAALLHHRLRRCRELGLELAAATSVPDGESSRNLVRAGFTEIYRQDVYEQT